MEPEDAVTGVDAGPGTAGDRAPDGAGRDGAGGLLAEVFPGEVLAVDRDPDMVSVQLVPAAVPRAARFLKERGFEVLLDVGGVDYLGRTPRFEVVYHFLSLASRERLRLRVPVDGDPPVVPTVSGVYRSAGWAEREVYDLFGIRFEGHPDLRRILMPDDWEGHPLRKDYPLQGPRAAAAGPAFGAPPGLPVKTDFQAR